MDRQQGNEESRRLHPRHGYQGARAVAKVLPATRGDEGADYRMHMALSALMLLTALVIANLR
jgi:hypothetical protein